MFNNSPSAVVKDVQKKEVIFVLNMSAKCTCVYYNIENWKL